MKYYKILNDVECHHNLRYKTGLNIDPIPFNPQGNCNPGGIYFASRDILAFLSWGPWIREVTLPDGEEIYTEHSKPTKYKSHRVILGPRRRINLDVIRELVENGADIHANDDYALWWAFENGNLDIVKYLVENGANIHAHNDRALRLASNNGHLDIVKYLVENDADIHAIDKYALRRASNSGHLNVVKYLMEKLNG